MGTLAIQIAKGDGERYDVILGRMGGRIVGNLPVFVGLLPRALANPKKLKNFRIFVSSMHLHRGANLPCLRAP